MSSITAILEPDIDGTVHLPVPADMIGKKIRVVADLQTVDNSEVPYKGTFMEAIEELRKCGGLNDVIPDPVAWQREQRQDRSLPGRD